MFSAVRPVLLLPLPFENPDALCCLVHFSNVPGRLQTRRGGDLSPADFLDYRAASSFEAPRRRCRRTPWRPPETPLRSSYRARKSLGFFSRSE